MRYVNDPRVIAQESSFVSINATIAVDLLGQCASETVGGSYYSSSGGQADFARGAMYSPGGQGFVVLHSTAKDGTISKIVPQLAAGDVVTTLKNTVDKVVTEWGVAELRGRSIRSRATPHLDRASAHPDHRDWFIDCSRPSSQRHLSRADVSLEPEVMRLFRRPLTRHPHAAGRIMDGMTKQITVGTTAVHRLPKP